MKREQTYVPNQQVLSAELNAWQDRNVGASAGNANNTHTTLTDGRDTIEWMYDTATLADATQVKVDGEIDYRDRLLTVTYKIPSGADQEPGGANDYLLDYQPTLHHGYTGLGALGAASATVVNGVPPVPAAGTSWALQLNTDVWLYADPSVGALYLYNATGSAIRRPILTVTASGTTGKRPPP